MASAQLPVTACVCRAPNRIVVVPAVQPRHSQATFSYLSFMYMLFSLARDLVLT